MDGIDAVSFIYCCLKKIRKYQWYSKLVLISHSYFCGSVGKGFLQPASLSVVTYVSLWCSDWRLVTSV